MSDAKPSMVSFRLEGGTDRVDALAEDAGMSRSEYLRSLVAAKGVWMVAGNPGVVYRTEIEALREAVRSMKRVEFLEFGRSTID